MKLVKKLSFLACLMPFSLAIANPAICIKPNMLYQAALSGSIYDIVPAVNSRNIVANRWYSEGGRSYSSLMKVLLNKNNHWVDDAGYDGREGADFVSCNYYDKDAHQGVVLNLFFPGY